MYTVDLYKIFEKKMQNGERSLHPINWIRSHIGSKLSWDLYNALPINFEAKIGEDIYSSRNEYKRIPKKLYKMRHNYFFSTPKYAINYENFIPEQSQLEQAIVDMMVFNDQSLILESKTPVGFIDCENQDSIIEVKKFSGWKSGLGQVLSYSVFRPKKKKILILFSCPKESKTIVNIRKVCANFDVSLIFAE